MKNYSNIICFDGLTSVLTKNGPLFIKDITPGMEVFSYDCELEMPIFDIVTAIAESRHSTCAFLEFDKELSLKCTIDHPLYVINKGWCAVNADNKGAYGVNVNQLKLGDVCLLIMQNDIVLTKVMSISIEHCSDSFYCLSTKESHNFFANGVLAHDINLEQFSNDLLDEEGIKVNRL